MFRNKSVPLQEEDKFKKKYNTFQNMFYVMKGTFHYQKPLLPLLIVNSFTEASMSFIWIIILKLVIDQVVNDRGVNSLIKIIIVAALIEWAFLSTHIFVNYQKWWRFIHANTKFNTLKMKKALTMKYEHLENPKVLDYMERAGRAVSGGQNGMEGMMNSVTSSSVNVVKILASIAILFTLSPWVVLAILFLNSLHYFLADYTKHYDKKNIWDPMMPFWRKIFYLDNVTKNFDYAKDVRLYGMHRWLHNKQVFHHTEAHKLKIKSNKVWIIYSLIYNQIGMLQEILLYGWVVYSVINGGVSISNAILYLGTIRTFSGTVTNIIDNVAEIRRQNLEVNDFRTFIEYPSEDEVKNYKPVPKERELEFVFDHVSFRYPGQEQYALKDMCLTLHKGHRLAVVGLNGAGKTTFIKLLCRLYDPTEGRILLNGTDIREFDRVEYYSLIAPVFQNVECFAFPISENISMKTPKHTDLELAKKCIVDAGLEEKLNSLPKGIQTELLKVLHEDGIDLSGGQKQKLALARALYKDAPVVVLDEPTAALDALAEYKLYLDFDQLIGKKTAVYISHRLSSTRFCQAIALFKDGKLAEYGTHEELLAQGGEYAKLFEVQAQYYQEGSEEVACCE